MACSVVMGFSCGMFAGFLARPLPRASFMAQWAHSSRRDDMYNPVLNHACCIRNPKSKYLSYNTTRIMLDHGDNV